MQKLKDNIGIYGFVFIAVAVIMFITGLNQHIIMTKEPIDIVDFDCDWKTLNKNDHIEADIEFCMGEVYSETTTETTYGIKTKEYESGMAYLVPHLNEDEEGYYFDGYMVMFVINKNDYSVIDKVTDDSVKFYNGEINKLGEHTFHINGKLTKLKKDEDELVMDILVNDLEYTEAEARDLLVPYKLSAQVDNFGTSIVISIVLLVIGGVLLTVSIIQKKKDREMAEMIARTRNATVNNTEDFMNNDIYNSETGRYENSSNNNTFN